MRLPHSIIPFHYDLELAPDIYENKSDRIFNGSVKIFFTVLRETDNITLHSSHNQVTPIEILCISKYSLQKTLKIWNTSFDNETQMFTIQLTDTLLEGQNFSLFLEFQGQLLRDMKGLYLSSYIMQVGNMTETRYEHL